MIFFAPAPQEREIVFDLELEEGRFFDFDVGVSFFVSQEREIVFELVVEESFFDLDVRGMVSVFDFVVVEVVVPLEHLVKLLAVVVVVVRQLYLL